MSWTTSHIIASSAFVVVAAALSCAQETRVTERATEGVGVTIYSAPDRPDQTSQQVWNSEKMEWQTAPAGYGIVKEWRKVRLDAPRSTVRFSDVASEIDATTVHFRSLTDPRGTSVVEQNFEYDLVSGDKILAKYVDHPIAVVQTNDAAISGTLLSFDAAQLVLRVEDSRAPIWVVRREDNLRNLRFSALPGGLITRPTLVWDIQTGKPGEHLVNVTYETRGMRWNADYTVAVSPDEKTLDLAAWVTIRNRSGALYKDAELKLVAGDVHRASHEGTADEPGAAVKAIWGERPRGFGEKSLFESHLYTLGHPTTLPENSIKQIELFDPVPGVPVRKIFRYASGISEPYAGDGPFREPGPTTDPNTKIGVYLEFRNSKDQTLGMPLPAGRIRAFKKDEADGALEFIGEDRIDHTPRDENVLINLGSAFDLVAERRRVDFDDDVSTRTLRETIEVRIRNHKDEDVSVLVEEHLYRWRNWEIAEKSHPYARKDARTVHFPLPVKGNSESILTYTVQYRW